MFETIRFENKKNTAVITLNRPDALNALSSQLMTDITSAIERSIRERARAIVIIGEGRAFCSGGDLREMRLMWETEGRIEAFLEEPLESLHKLIILMRKTPIPFIAAVNGVCAGAGTNLALACDLVFASEDASFNEAFIKIGLSPDCGGSFFLPRAVGSKLSAEMFMTGDAVSADTALSIGMINRVVTADGLKAEAVEMANRLALAPTAVIGRIKEMLNSTFSNDLETQLGLEHRLQLESGRGADFKEGVSAFLEKRPPEFTGD